MGRDCRGREWSGSGRYTEKDEQANREIHLGGDSHALSLDRQHFAWKRRLLAASFLLPGSGRYGGAKGTDCFAPVLVPLNSRGGHRRVESYGSLFLTPPLTPKIPQTTARGKTPSLMNFDEQNR